MKSYCKKQRYNVAKIIPALFCILLMGCSSAKMNDENQVFANESEQLHAVKAIVTTGQSFSYDGDGNIIYPTEGQAFYGQDSVYQNVDFSFLKRADLTTIDNNTGLMWQSNPSSEKMSFAQAVEYVENLTLGGYTDWRLPTVTELFSISDFSQGWPYIDTYYFAFGETSENSDMQGNPPPQEGMPPQGGPQGGGPQGEGPQGGRGGSQGRPPIDDTMQGGFAMGDESMPPPPPDSSDAGISKEGGQFWTISESAVDQARLKGIAFGVNHVTGHIKAYPSNNTQMGKYVRAVRGDVYAQNQFVDNGDGTTTDNATGLMWSTLDLGVAVDWEEALALCENAELAGYTDWRLPDVKELQSIVDYSGVYPAINHDYFECTELPENENYYFWTSTSAYFSAQDPRYNSAWYVAFGYTSHGAGAVRFSPKYVGSDAIAEGEDNILNSVRLVRNIN